MDNSGFRPHWFNKEICYNSIQNDLDEDDSFHVLFDGKNNELPKYINEIILDNLLCFNGGSDAHSYKQVLDYVKNTFVKGDIIYIVEDDYLHLPGWSNVLREGAKMRKTNYWTLYDHPDKYEDNNLSQSFIFKSDTSFWRTASSTTNTVAFRYETLMRHWSIHEKYCDFKAGMTWDHAKFLEIYETFKDVVSYPIPGHSTHCDNRAISPLRNWEKLSKIL